MHSFRLSLLGSGLCFGLALLYTEACTPAQRQEAVTALNVADTLCLSARQALPDVQALKACGILDAARQPLATQILAGLRADTAAAVASAKSGTPAPATDAGAPSSTPSTAATKH